jgi:peptidoglycan hydrolase-like protein with peptidoglycan-binding domain
MQLLLDYLLKGMNTRKIISIGALAIAFGLVTSVAIPNSTLAASNGKTFDKNLSHGAKNSADVKDLQDFLSKEGHLKVFSTGNFLDLTTKAVKSFQTANKIPATGFFGPLTRAAVNVKLAGQSNEAKLSITSHKGGEKIEVGNKQTIKYSSTNYTSPKVKVNIIKKVASNPNRYEFVRTVSGVNSNDGSATWVPTRSEIGSNILIEVGCIESETACRAGITSATLAIVDSTKYQNTASAFDAIERADNK